ncbi:MAG: hypothetical protein ABH844_02725 [Candidatus Omnitrophota bacterium]
MILKCKDAINLVSTNITTSDSVTYYGHFPEIFPLFIITWYYINMELAYCSKETSSDVRLAILDVLVLTGIIGVFLFNDPFHLGSNVLKFLWPHFFILTKEPKLFYYLTIHIHTIILNLISWTNPLFARIPFDSVFVEAKIIGNIAVIFSGSTMIAIIMHHLYNLIYVGMGFVDYVIARF